MSEHNRPSSTSTSRFTIAIHPRTDGRKEVVSRKECYKRLGVQQVVHVVSAIGRQEASVRAGNAWVISVERVAVREEVIIVPEMESVEKNFAGYLRSPFCRDQPDS